MSHTRVFSQLVLALCLFCFSATRVAACDNADASRCVGSSKDAQVTFTARMQSPSCNVSLGGESNLGGQSMSIDFGQVRYEELTTKDERYSRPVGIFFTGCNSAFKNRAQVTFSVSDKCELDTACNNLRTMGVRIKDRAIKDYITVNTVTDMTLTTGDAGFSAMYDFYLVKGRNYMPEMTLELPIQVMVQYK